MFAIIRTGGKQYKVSPKQVIRIEKLPEKEGGVVRFRDVLLVADGSKVEIGTPLVKGVVIEGKVRSHGRGKKLIVFRYHSKTRYRKKKGHRQPYTEVEITNIKLAKEPKAAGVTRATGVAEETRAARVVKTSRAARTARASKMKK